VQSSGSRLATSSCEFANNNALRAAYAVSRSSQLGISASEILTQLKPYRRGTWFSLDEEREPEDYIANIINDFDGSLDKVELRTLRREIMRQQLQNS
jgi:hypothetical protein